jgi:nitroimidazol reductase NimA-like FMN-containing flavoprotein (pyridoxamine 5'-phosphate oxidase superfamily)
MINNLPTIEGIKLLKDNYIGHLGFISQGGPYIVPITYFYDEESNSIISYSEEGHKISAMRQNTAVSLAVEEITSIEHWHSILAHGIFEELTGTDAKFKLHKFAEGVKGIISRKENKYPKFIRDFSSATHTEALPIVYQIKIQEITGKFRKGNPPKP